MIAMLAKLQNHDWADCTAMHDIMVTVVGKGVDG